MKTKNFNALKDHNGTTVKHYVELTQEKAADHGWLSVNVFFNPDEKGADRFHFKSNIENFEEVLGLGAAYALSLKKAAEAPAAPTPEKEIEVVSAAPSRAAK